MAQEAHNSKTAHQIWIRFLQKVVSIHGSVFLKNEGGRNEKTEIVAVRDPFWVFFLCYPQTRVCAL